MPIEVLLHFEREGNHGVTCYGSSDCPPSFALTRASSKASRKPMTEPSNSVSRRPPKKAKSPIVVTHDGQASRRRNKNRHAPTIGVRANHGKTLKPLVMMGSRGCRTYRACPGRRRAIARTHEGPQRKRQNVRRRIANIDGNYWHLLRSAGSAIIQTSCKRGRIKCERSHSSAALQTSSRCYSRGSRMLLLTGRHRDARAMIPPNPQAGNLIAATDDGLRVRRMGTIPPLFPSRPHFHRMILRRR